MIEFIELETPDRYLLPGLLFKAAGKSTKAAIYLHGNGGGAAFHSPKKINLLAKELNKKGISLLAFNNRGAEIIYEPKTAKGERGLFGSAMEEIADCAQDISGAVKFLEEKGYDQFYLIGHSTGANKAALYNFLHPRNKIEKFVLTGPGDDTGWWYKTLGPKPFADLLDEARQQTKVGNGSKLSSQALKIDEYMSFQALYDTLNPDGDYNIYPFYEYKNHLDLSSKELFQEFKSIKKPVLVLYGSEDEYCEGAREAVEILKSKSWDTKQFTANIIEGADHKFTGFEKELAKTIADFLSI